MELIEPILMMPLHKNTWLEPAVTVAISEFGYGLVMYIMAAMNKYQNISKFALKIMLVLSEDYLTVWPMPFNIPLIFAVNVSHRNKYWQYQNREILNILYKRKLRKKFS